jgi:uncharacterized membrane protein
MSSNPYAAPKAAVADETTLVKGNFVPGGRGVAAGRGVSWIGEAWDLFKKSPGLWIGMVILLFVIFFVLAFIPFLGSIATMVLGPVFTGGIMLGCRALDEGGELEFGHLFAGFQQKFGTLAAIGGLYMAGTIAVMVLVMVVTGASMFAVVGMGGGAEQADPMAMVATMGIAILVGMALMLPLVMAIWMAAPLAVLSDQGAFEAMKASFMGCLKNIVPFLLYSLVMFVLAIVATLPIMLGWLVLGPMLAASVYASYRDIYFTD